MKKVMYIFVFISSFISCFAQGSDDFFLKGKRKYDSKDYVGAIPYFTICINTSDGMEISALLLRGISKVKLNDYRGAISDLDKVISYKEGGYISEISEVKAIRMTLFGGEDYYYRGFAKLKLGYLESGCLDLSKAGESGYTRAYNLISIYCK